MQLHVIEFCNVIKRAESELCVLHPQRVTGENGSSSSQ